MRNAAPEFRISHFDPHPKILGRLTASADRMLRTIAFVLHPRPADGTELSRLIVVCRVIENWHVKWPKARPLMRGLRTDGPMFGGGL